MQDSIRVSDENLQVALHFMITIATISEELQSEIAKNPEKGINYQAYQDKIHKYLPTYTGMKEDFFDNVFGHFSNKITREDFINNLTVEGWKYFNSENLKEIFTVMLERHGAFDEENQL